MVSIDSALFASVPRHEKSPGALRTISEAADILDVPQHVLRFWETKFHHIKPLKRNGGRRFYRPQDLEVLQRIKHLLYSQGYTIKGAKKAIDDFTAGRGDWLNTLPDANMNDNVPLMEDDPLAEIAEALAEEPALAVAAPAPEPIRITETLRVSPHSNREALAALRIQLAQARDKLAERVTTAA
jgi:DNA-binding transcriptional MerR regulator